MIQVACSTRCFPLKSPARALSRIAWAGFRAVEVSVPAGEELSAEVLGERLEAEDLALVAIDAGVVTASSPEAAMEAAAHLGRCAVAAYRLGAARVVFTAPPSGEGRIEHLAYGLSRLIAAIRAVPVAFCVRAQPGSLVPSLEAMADLLQAADAVAPNSEPLPSARLCLALDPASVTLDGGDPEQVLRAALDGEVPVVLGHVYLTDCRVADGPLADTQVAPGDGELEWGRLSGALLAGGYSGPVTVLIEDVDPLFAETEAKEAAAFANALFPDALFTPGDGR